MWFACVVVWLLVAEGGCFYNAISFGKQLYIPGQYFSLMNFSKNTQALSDYFDVAIDYSLGQVKIGSLRWLMRTRATRFTTSSCSSEQTMRYRSLATIRQWWH